MRIDLDDLQDPRMILSERFAWKRHNLNNDIVSDVRRGIFEMLNDECMEYDELDDESQCHTYLSIADSNHIYMFSILEPLKERKNRFFLEKEILNRYS